MKGECFYEQMNVTRHLLDDSVGFRFFKGTIKMQKSIYHLLFLPKGLHRSQQGGPQLLGCSSLPGKRTLETYVLSGSHPRAPNPPEPEERRRRKNSSSVLLCLDLSQWVRTSPVAKRHQQQPVVSCLFPSQRAITMTHSLLNYALMGYFLNHESDLYI